MQDGSRREVVADEEYLRRAILEPHADQVVDYPPNMPPPVDLSDDEVEMIIEYIRGLAENSEGETEGEGAR
jgi:cytochrome c oxidase subunit 2